MLSPLESAEFIAKNAKDVEICEAGVHNVANMVFEAFKSKSYSVSEWKKHALNPSEANANSIEWIFVVDSLNFSFWTPPDAPKYQVEYKGELYTGYWSLCAAINRAIDEGITILSPKYYGQITLSELKKLFRSVDSQVEIPLIEKRLEILQENARVLIEKYKGSFGNCVREANGDAQRLISRVVEDFPSFRDDAHFNGKQVSFLKRAQILVADLWACFEGERFGEFQDIDSITVFADYRVPQVLHYFGALKYSPELRKTLESVLENKCKEEVEIRGCTIYCAELIRREVERRLKNNSETEIGDSRDREHQFNSILLDFYLWDYRRNHAKEIDESPYHKVRCIYY